MIRLRIKDIMDERKIKQVDMVKLAPINRTTMSKYYHNYGSQADLVILQRIARALGVKVVDLIEEDEQ